MKEYNNEGVLNLIEALLTDSFSTRQIEDEDTESVKQSRLYFIDSKILDLYLNSQQLNIDPNVLRQACHLKQNGKPYHKTLQRLGIDLTERFN